MSKTPRRIAYRIRDPLTLHALSVDPDVRIRVTWKDSKRSSYYHGACAVSVGEQVENWVSGEAVKVHAVRRAQGKWAHWRACCPHCRGTINVPGRKPEQLTWDLALP